MGGNAMTFTCLCARLCCLLLLGVAQSFAYAESFPRLLGMNIGAKHYQAPEYQRSLAKLDIVVLGFYQGWGEEPEAMRAVVRLLKRMNPRLRVGQYGVMNELRDVPEDHALADILGKVDNAGWWLRNESDKRVQWTQRYKAWEVNFTQLANPDADGKRYPQWLAERDDRVYHQAVPEFDFWYADNVMHRPRIRADWDGDGVNDDQDSPQILKAWREGYVDWWSRIRELSPDKMVLGNADGDLSEPEFRNQLEGVFLEGLMGKKWSIEARQGWVAMMTRYRAVKDNLREPRIVGFNVWGDPSDYRFFRYAYTSCLLDDGYFSFTDKRTGYSSVPWFDEYDFVLGKAVSPPPLAAWKNGIWRRDFEHGVVLVNPGNRRVQIDIEAGFRHFAGAQDPAINSGKSVQKLIFSGKDGLILVRQLAS